MSSDMRLQKMGRKIAIMFPGQGSQYVGMGRDFYEEYKEARETLNTAEEVLRFPLSSIIFEGPEEKLNRTSICQPALLSVSFSIFKVLMREQKRRNFTFDIEAALGHSLGEYTALVSAGVLDFSEGVLLVHKRGRFMEEVQNGGMVAILGLGSEDVGDIVKNIEGVEIANLNCPGQIVIAGENLSLKEAEIESKKRGARLTLKLKVSIPSHSSYMKGAKEKLREEVKKIEFKSPSFPVVPNYLALPMRDSSPLKEAIIEQMTNPVRWEESVQKLIDSGVETFIEIGPGKVLSGLVKRVNRDTECLRVSDLKSMEETIRALNET